MKKFCIPILSLCLILCCCKKEYKEITVVKVHIVNKLTGQLIQDTLRFKTNDNQTIHEFLFYGIKQVTLDDKFLSGGIYTYSFYASKDSKKVEHNYAVDVDGNYKYEKYYGVSAGGGININQANLITLELYPYAYRRLKFKNMDCSVPTFFSFTEYHLEEPDFFNEGFTSFDGCTNYLGSTYYAVPMGNIHFEWHVTRNSITEIFHDTVYFDAGDSVIYEINY